MSSTIKDYQKRYKHWGHSVQVLHWKRRMERDLRRFFAC